MAYVRTQWANNVTRLNATNMNNIEDGVEQALQASAQTASDQAALAERVTTLEGKELTFSDPNHDGNIVIS